MVAGDNVSSGRPIPRAPALFFVRVGSRAINRESASGSQAKAAKLCERVRQRCAQSRGNCAHEEGSSSTPITLVRDAARDDNMDQRRKQEHVLTCSSQGPVITT